MELRAYFFQNMYLQAMHAGIQSQHTTAEMFVKYRESSNKRDILYDWAEEHKTTIVLNGGYSSHLIGIVECLRNKDNPYPWTFFEESEEALNGAITNVGIIVPDRIFNAKVRIEELGMRLVDSTMYKLEEFTPFEWELVELITSRRLMN